MKNPDYISLKEAENYCSYSADYLKLRARQKKLKAVKIGRAWLTKKEWVKEYNENVQVYKETRKHKNEKAESLKGQTQNVKKSSIVQPNRNVKAKHDKYGKLKKTLKKTSGKNKKSKNIFPRLKFKIPFSFSRIIPVMLLTALIIFEIFFGQRLIQAFGQKAITVFVPIIELSGLASKDLNYALILGTEQVFQSILRISQELAGNTKIVALALYDMSGQARNTIGRLVFEPTKGIQNAIKKNNHNLIIGAMVVRERFFNKIGIITTREGFAVFGNFIKSEILEKIENIKFGINYAMTTFGEYGKWLTAQLFNTKEKTWYLTASLLKPKSVNINFLRVTIYDETTGQPYCVFISQGRLMNIQGGVLI